VNLGTWSLYWRSKTVGKREAEVPGTSHYWNFLLPLTDRAPEVWCSWDASVRYSEYL